MFLDFSWVSHSPFYIALICAILLIYFGTALADHRSNRRLANGRKQYKDSRIKTS